MRDTEEMQKCPYCAELIKRGAVKCRYCGSTIGDIRGDAPSAAGDHWRRVSEGKRVAGVCTGLAREFNTPKLILPLRVFFVLTTIFYGFGFILYILLWLLMSGPKGTTAPPAGSPSNDVPAPGNAYRRRFKPVDFFLGLLVLAAGMLLVLAPFGGSVFSGGAPWRGPFPMMMPATRAFSLISGIWPVLIMLGMFLLFFGALRMLRLAVGCGMIAMGAVFLVIFLPFLPGVFAFPGIFIIGIIMILIGIMKLVFGSTEQVSAPVTAQHSPDDGSSAGGNGWTDYEEA